MPATQSPPREDGTQTHAVLTDAPDAGLRRKILAYGASRTTVDLLFAGRGILLANLLGPESFGIWALFRMGLRYCAFSAMGLLRGLELEVSRAGHPSQSAHTAAQSRWGRVAVGQTLLLYGTLSMGTAIAWLWPGQTLPGLALLGIAIGLLADRLWAYGLTFLRASGNLRQFAVLELSQAALQLVASVVLALWWGVTGAFVGFALANLLGILMIARRAPFWPIFSRQEVRHLARIGFPISLMGILTATLLTVDRWLVGLYLGVGALGAYAFAVSLSEVGVSLALVVRTVVLRDVYGKTGSSVEPASSRAPLDRPLAGFANLTPPLAGLVGIVLPLGFEIFVAEYRSVAPVARLLLFCGLAQGLINIAVLGITAEGRQHLLPRVSIAAVCISAVLSLGALGTGLGLEGVAFAALSTRLMYAAAIIALLARVQRLSSPRAAIVEALGPFVWCAFVAITLGYLLPVTNFEEVVAPLLLYVVFVLPVLPFAKRAFRGGASPAL